MTSRNAKTPPSDDEGDSQPVAVPREGTHANHYRHLWFKVFPAHPEKSERVHSLYIEETGQRRVHDAVRENTFLTRIIGMRDAVIFDMDGTLCDVSSIIHHVQGEDRNYDAFHGAAIDCPPIAEVVAGVEQARKDGFAIVIVTARSAKWRDYTIKWLDRLEIGYDALYTRIEADFRPDYEIKADILKDLKQDFNPVHAWDDSPKIIKLWRDNGIDVTKVASDR